MMELTCALVLIVAGIVSATPYGYGVKGGGSARAESSASTGAFGGVGFGPVAVPLGTDFSGSFSKSSSSSSSSSSASSSSSSSSFSYNSSGANGLSGLGLNSEQSNVGCSTGNCQITGINGTPASHGTSLQGYNTGNAAATAEAEALSESQCKGLSCNNNSEKCAPGQCKPKTQTGNPSTEADTSKCTSGQCGSASEKGASATEYGHINDIRVVSESSDSVHNSKDQSSNVDTTSTIHDGAGSDCSGGNCGSSGPFSLQPNYGHVAENSYQGSGALNKQPSSSLDAGVTSHYNKPATHLETPKLGSKCNSPECLSEPVDSGHGTSPTSYNVPIHGSYDNVEEKPTCDGVKCENQPKQTHPSTNSNSLSTNYLSPQHSLVTDNSIPKASSNDFISSTNCEDSKCIGIQSPKITRGSSLSLGPGYINFGQSPSNAPVLTVTSCNTPNCSPYPTIPSATAGPNVPSRHIGNHKPNHEIKPSNDKVPVYTGGFGGPTGVYTPNEFNVATPTGNPSHPHLSTQNGLQFGSTPTVCNSPSCSGYPSSSGGNTQSGTFIYTPGVIGEKLPSYTGGFGGPAGMLKPNEFDIHATVAKRPGYVNPTSSSHHTQPPSFEIATMGCQTPNCGGYSPTAVITSGATAPSGSFGTVTPTTAVSTTPEKLPVYTGGFGGPGGVLKPGEYNGHTTAPSIHSHTLSTAGNSAGCKTPNCYPSNIGTTIAANTQSESFGVTKPVSGVHFPSITLPSEVLTPNKISAPALAPIFPDTQSSPSQGSYSTECKTGNCAIPNIPQHTGSYSGPSGTLKPNDHSYQTPSTVSAPTNCKSSNCVNSATADGGALFGANSPSEVNAESGANTQSGANAQSGANFQSETNSQSGSFTNTKPSGGFNSLSTEKLPTYTGGFGGASGLLRPNEYTVPVTSLKPHDYNALAPTSVSKPVACTSGNCNSQVPQNSAAHSNVVNGIHTAAEAAADATAVVYTGGFGGLPGVLKPYDSGKIGVSHGSQIGGYYSSPNPNVHSPQDTNSGAISGTTAYATGTTSQASALANTAEQAGSIAGSTAYSGALAGASSGTSFGYNTHGSHYNHAGNIKGASPCAGGCGGASGAAYSGGANLNFSGGHGLSQLGYADGSNGFRSIAGATAKSLAGVNAFGVGASSASSSAHASSGTYTKGGYGKR